jgi:hypothetical protein
MPAKSEPRVAPVAAKPQPREDASSKPQVHVDPAPAKPATRLGAVSSQRSPASPTREADDPGAVIDWLLRGSGRN